jgi:hypothetical protein
MEIANRWILQFKRDQQSGWLPFGLPHSFDEGAVRLDEVRVRLSDSEWRLVNVTTGGVLHDRRPDAAGDRPA